MSDSGSNLNAANLRRYWDMLRFRGGPEHLPVSFALLAGTVVARVLLGVLISEALPQQDAHGTALVLIDAVVVLLWGALVLRLAGVPERYQQTLSAVFGVELVLQPLLAPAAWFYGTYSSDPSLGGVALLLVYALGVWALVALVRILRAATGWPILACVGMALFQEMVTMLVAILLFPDLLPQADALPKG